MARAPSKAERARLHEVLFSMVSGIAQHGHACPALDVIGQQLRVSGNTVKVLLDELEAAHRIVHWVKFRQGIGWVRFVRIVATNQVTGEPAVKPREIGKAARKLMNHDRNKRIEGQQLDRKIYGPLLSDVMWLRHRGWVVTKERDGFRVGNKVLAAADVVEKAARERRLAGVAQ